MSWSEAIRTAWWLYYSAWKLNSYATWLCNHSVVITSQVEITPQVERRKENDVMKVMLRKATKVHVYV